MAKVDEFRSCTRGEFARRALAKFPMLTEANLKKLIDRGHVPVERREGCYLRFTAESWDALEHFMVTRSRVNRQCIMGGLK